MNLKNKVLNKLKSIVHQTSFRIGREFPTVTQVDGHRIKFIVANEIELIMRSKLSYTEEESTIKWIHNYVAPDDIVYDIGANVGAYSLLIGLEIKKNGGRGKVYAFEPESLNFSSLNKNIYANNLQGIVIPIPLAIGTHRGIENFYLSKFERGAAVHGLYRPSSDGVDFNAAHQQGIV